MKENRDHYIVPEVTLTKVRKDYNNFLKRHGLKPETLRHNKRTKPMREIEMARLLDHSEMCEICNKKTDEDELAEFQGKCFDCYKAECDREFNNEEEQMDKECRL